jgi:hypothetical protein
MLRARVGFSLSGARFDDAAQTSAEANMTMINLAHVIT